VRRWFNVGAAAAAVLAAGAIVARLLAAATNDSTRDPEVGALEDFAIFVGLVVMVPIALVAFGALICGLAGASGVYVVNIVTGVLFVVPALVAVQAGIWGLVIVAPMVTIAGGIWGLSVRAPTFVTGTRGGRRWLRRPPDANSRDV